MAEHKHGSMKIDAQEKAFAGFISVVTYAVIFIVVLLVFTAIVNG